MRSRKDVPEMPDVQSKEWYGLVIDEFVRSRQREKKHLRYRERCKKDRAKNLLTKRPESDS